MRRILVATVLALACAGCSSNSNSSTTDPVQLCKNFVTATCNRVFACFPTEAAQVYTSASNCITTVSAQACTTQNVTCDPGKTFNTANANQCATEYANQSCADIQNGVTPTSCSNVCT